MSDGDVTVGMRVTPHRINDDNLIYLSLFLQSNIYIGLFHLVIFCGQAMVNWFNVHILRKLLERTHVLRSGSGVAPPPPPPPSQCCKLL